MGRARAAVGLLLLFAIGAGAWWLLHPASRVASRPSELVAPDVEYFEEHDGEGTRPWGLARTSRGETRFRPTEGTGVAGDLLEGGDSEIQAGAALRANDARVPSLASDLAWRRFEKESSRFSLRTSAPRALLDDWWRGRVSPDSSAEGLLAPLRDLVFASDRIVGAVHPETLVAILLPETAPAGLLFAEANLATFPFEEVLPPGDVVFGASYRTDDAGRWGSSFGSGLPAAASLFTEGSPGEIARVIRRGVDFALARHELGSETALSRLGAILPFAPVPPREGWPLRGFASAGGGRGALLDLGGGSILAIQSSDESDLDAALDEALDPSGTRRLTVHPDYAAFRELLPPRFAAILAWRDGAAPETHVFTRAVGFTGPEGDDREASLFIVTRGRN